MGKKQNPQQKKTNNGVSKGRPPQKNVQKQSEQVDNSQTNECNQNQITNHKPCIKIIKTLTHAGQIRLKTITGDKKAVKEKRPKVELISKNKKRLFYFLANKTRAELTFHNGQLFDTGIYVQIERKLDDALYDDLIDKINIVCKELDEDFIKELGQILYKFIELYKRLQSEQELVNQILKYINLNEQNFKYIHEWYQAKKEIYIEQLNFNKEQLEIEQKSKEFKHSHGRPKEKKEEIIKNKLQKIDEEIICDPLKYLISKLVNVFLSVLQNNSQGEIDLSSIDFTEQEFIYESLQPFYSYSEDSRRQYI